MSKAKVFIVNQEYKAKYKVFFVDQEYKQKNHQIISPGELVKQEYQADAKVFIVDQEQSGYQDLAEELPGLVRSCVLRRPRGEHTASPISQSLKAKDTSLLTFMKNATQSIIPIYQRTYSWQREQCEQLWSDVLHAGSSADEPSQALSDI